MIANIGYACDDVQNIPRHVPCKTCCGVGENRHKRKSRRPPHYPSRMRRLCRIGTQVRRVTSAISIFSITATNGSVLRRTVPAAPGPSSVEAPLQLHYFNVVAWVTTLLRTNDQPPFRENRTTCFLSFTTTHSHSSS